MTMPLQKPGRSKQNYGTPPEFLAAVRDRLCITKFALDVAADSNNTVCGLYYSIEDNGLDQYWNRAGGWNWCNPPYGNIRPWVSKARREAMNGANTAMLVPASVGANWWRDYVEPDAYQVYLNGRLTFVGETKPYIKDCALLLYTPWGFTGQEIWGWRGTVYKLQQQQLSKDKRMSEMLEL